MTQDDSIASTSTMRNFLKRAWDDFRIALIFLTRIPIPFADNIARQRITESMGAFPLVGAMVGAAGGLVYWAAVLVLGNPPVCACLMIAAQLRLTGAFHEDGLADAADALGGAANRTRRLEILRDSRIGTYGAAALTSALLLRAMIAAALAEPIMVLVAYVSSGMISRAMIVTVMFAVPPAQMDGLSAEAGRPSLVVTIFATTIALLGLLILWPPIQATTIAIIAGLAAAYIGHLSMRHLGGQTGDLLGTTQQVSEISALLVILAFAR